MSEENIFASNRMTNDDFRQLLKTPRASVPEEIEIVKIVQRKEKVKENKEPEKKDEAITFKTKMGRNIYKTLMAIESKTFVRCEIYTPGRMAYVFDLDDENAEADIPTTLIRSKADVPTIDSTTSLTTNDVVINRLTTMFSYTRPERRNGKKEKETKDIQSRPEDFKELELAPTQLQDDSIYGDIEDYVTIDDSDDESDCIIIMDRGNKKGPIDRPDTPEEYDECKNNTEALPKTAFQCGVKMADGRRTGKYNKEKTEKAKLDIRVSQRIQQILNKRKSTFGDGGRAFKVLRC